MKVQGEHKLKASPQQVWDALQDPQMLTNSIPGVSRLEVTGPDEYVITVAAGVGAIKGTYDGTFGIYDKVAPETCTVRGSAAGAPGSIDGSAVMHLSAADDGGSLLEFECDANVTGPLAGVGQRMIAAAAKKTTAEFLDAIDRNIANPPVPGAAGDGEPAAAGAAATSGAPAAGQVFTRSAPAGAGSGAGGQAVPLGVGIVAGFALAILGILFGRWISQAARR